MTPQQIIDEIQVATELRDPDRIEFAVASAYRLGLSPDIVPAFVWLMGELWHTRHEDIARALQELKDSRAVSALESAALVDYPYLAFDENFALARKCTWALADIGTIEAKQALARLASNARLEVSSFAQKRLDNWGMELSRKGPDYAHCGVNQTLPARR